VASGIEPNVIEYGPPTSVVEVVVPTAAVRGPWFPTCHRSLRESAAWSVRVVAVESSGPGFNFARSVNVGLSRTVGDVLVLNDDVRLAAGTLDALLRAVGIKAAA